MDTHEIDLLIWWPTAYEALSRWKQDPELVVERGNPPGYGVHEIFINHNNTILSDVRVRKALALAVNKTYIVEKAFMGFGVVAHNVINDRWNTYYDPNAAQSEYDVTEANRLLDEAGYTKDADNIRFSLELMYDPATTLYILESEALAAGILKATGIVLKLVPLETATYYKRLGQGRFDLAIYAMSRGPDPMTGLSVYWSQNILGTLGTNMGRFVNATYDDLYVKQRIEGDLAKRVQMVKDMQMILKEQVAGIWLADDAGYGTYSKKFKNFIQDSAQFETFATTWESSLAPAAPSEPPYVLIGVAAAIIIIIIAAFVFVRKRRVARH
jgi:peptide/nickel transport system substrate-binding protein